ncbi:hypothetical protein BDV93DRAFT_582513 [Ceratobasidium sp. AG-I]|nr:hypothetical protein BDV93DRAFT_582513 [Ceratobasidium sp. AG-I]
MDREIPLPRVRELGFRIGEHDLQAASMSMLSFVMDHGEEDRQGEYGDQHPDYEYPEERRIGSGQEWERTTEDVREDECGVDQHEDLYDEDEPGDAMGAEDEDGVGPRRRQKARKARRPYTVTMALRKTNWFESSLEWENEHFRVVYRVSKDTFWGMVDILGSNPIFQSQGRKKQRPVHYQLGVFLLRYGISGSHLRHPKLLTSIGEGTVVLYCRRVIRAIREHGLVCVVWPSAERKEQIKAGFKKLCGLDNVIGSLDGTLCGLETKPRESGDSYISRKKTPSVNVQAIVDHDGQFIAFQSGWVGSRPDRGIWQDMWVYLERDRLFSPGEFLLADGGKQQAFN